MRKSARQRAHSAALVALGACLLGAPRATLAAPVDGPELNPYACQGQAEALQSDRSISQIRAELEKRMDPEFLPTDPATIRALKLCTLGELKKRVGDADAIDYYERAIRENPDEPGYEFFAGRYYGGARGAEGPVVEAAEKYFYRAVDKLEKLKEKQRYRDFHKVIEDHTRKALLLLYQEDGLPLLPWKAYKQGPSGYPAPGLSIGTQLSISKDTRDQVGANEVGSFAAELALYERGPIAAADEHRFAVARAPLRYGAINTLRLRHTHFGRLDLQYARLRAEAAAFDKFADIGVRNAKLHDINVEEYGAEYERVIPLYPLFDLKLRGGVKHVHRVGVVEHWPDYAQDFPVYELKPAISRFIGSDKLTLHGTYVFMAIPRLDGVAQAQLKDDDPLLKRGRAILAVNVEYAFYSPLLLPSLHLASLRPYRTPTRGFYLSAGYVSDNELYGDRRIINDTLFGGARLEGPGAWDIGITESWYRGRGRDIKLEGEVAAPDLSGSSLRTTVVLTRRLVNPDATPGVPEAYGPFAPDTLNVVFPASYDHVLTGDRSFENFRVGAQLWWKVFGTGLWGTTALMTVGYDYQYFYRFGEHAHNVAARLRIGWGDL